MVSVALTKYTGALFVDSFSEAVVSEEGAVNIYRNGFGGNSGFAPICGESRFSTFTIAGTGSAAALYNGEGFQPHLEWPYLYTLRASVIRTVWKTNLLTAALTQATASPGSGADPYAITSRPEVSYADYLRGTLSSNAQHREWTKASEPSASTTLITAVASPYDFNHFFLDVDENYWLGGLNGVVRKTDPFGSTIFSTTLPVDGTSIDYVNGMFVPDGVGGAVCFLEQTDGQMDWFFVDSTTGAYTDITANVTIDGVAWDTVAPGVFGGPNVVTTQAGSRIGFRIGSDYYIADMGQVSRKWWVGSAGWA